MPSYISEASMIRGVNNITVDTLKQTLTVHQHHDARGQPLDLLQRQCSLSAQLNAKERLNPPRCAAETRQTIIQSIEDWISTSHNNDAAASLFWLNGGAGVGKSALAQTLADKFQKRDLLAAAFFFFKSDASRNNGDQLIPTLVSQLISKAFNEMTPFVEESIRTNPELFTQLPEIQILNLLIEPLTRLSVQDFDKSQPMASLKSRPRLIIIDGLDECKHPNVQCELLRLIAAAIPHFPYPLRFLIASRPEAHILQAFSELHSDQALNMCQYNLSDDPQANDDISRYLYQSFQNIRRVHHLKQHLSPDWPGEAAISSLVDRSSHHFVYASTVVRYLESRDDRPDKRLSVILGLAKRRDNARPYAQLDDLFSLIFLDIEEHRRKQLICAFGIMYLRSQRCGGVFDDYWLCFRDAIQELFDIDPTSFFDRLRSLVAIDQDIRNLHKVIFDYLLDSTRSGNLCIDFEFVHQTAANYILTKKLEPKGCSSESLLDTVTCSTDPISEFRHFAYHCQFSSLTDTLRNYLIQCSSEIPLQQQLVKTSQWELPAESLPLSVFYMFRTLGRTDPNLDVKTYFEYAKHIETHVNGNVTFFQRVQFLFSGLGTNPRFEEIDLQSHLRSWKPQSRGLLALRKDENVKKRVACIAKEHGLLLSYIQVTHPNTVIFASISNKDFIHNYYYSIDEDQLRYLILFTYATNSSMVAWSTFGPANLASEQGAGTGLLNRIKDHLKRLETSLALEVYDCSYHSSHFGYCTK